MKLTYVYPPEETAHAEAYFARWQRKHSHIPEMQKRLPKIVGGALALAAIAVIMGITAHWHRVENPDWHDYAELFGLVAVVLIVWGDFIVKTRIAKYMLSTEPPLGLESTVSIDTEGILSTFAGRRTGTDWRRVSFVEEDERFLYVICDVWEVYFVTRNAFSAPSEYSAFRDEINERFRKSRS